MKESRNPWLYYEPSTYPGRRLPHAWLNTAVPSPLVSTLDVAGKGGFTLFTGIGGEKWRDAAMFVKELEVTVKAVGVGPGLHWEDPYIDWTVKRDTDEDGCVLARPDYFVAWRSQSGGNEVQRLTRVVGGILGLKET